MTSSLQRAATVGKPFQGRSGYGTRWTGAAETGGARARRQRHPEGTILGGKPGSTIKASDREYFVRDDGSFKRIHRVGGK